MPSSLYQRIPHVLVDKRILTVPFAVKTKVHEDLAKYGDIFTEEVVGVQSNAREVPQLVEMKDNIKWHRSVGIVLPADPFEALASLTSLIQPEIGVALLPVSQLAQSLR